MLILWKSQYLDCTVKQFRERTLFVDTNRLTKESKAGLESTLNSDGKADWRIVPFRPLFKELQGVDLDRVQEGDETPRFVVLVGYLEDERGREI